KRLRLSSRFETICKHQGEKAPMLANTMEKHERAERMGANLMDAIAAYARQYNVSKAVACERVCLSPIVSEAHRLEKREAELSRFARNEATDPVEFAAELLERLADEYQKANPGTPRGQALMAAAVMPAFSAAHRQERVQKYGQ